LTEGENFAEASSHDPKFIIASPCPEAELKRTQDSSPAVNRQQVPSPGRGPEQTDKKNPPEKLRGKDINLKNRR
jgi:hypothetical protein